MTAPRSFIDYRLLSHAVEAYASFGFRQVEVPWRVGYRIAAATAPPDAIFASCNPGGDVLVGSAEQGFLAIALAGEISPSDGPLFAVSPCFRDGDAGRSDLHVAEFVKLELWRQLGDGDSATRELKRLVSAATSVLRELGAKAPELRATSENSADLEIDGIEVGSYGYREAVAGKQTVRWIYGTGLALPRFSQALARAGQGRKT